MSGTHQGGLKATETMKENYGEDYFRKIGAKGGKVGTTGGFATEKMGKDGLTGKERARKAGVIGGSKSRREYGKDYGNKWTRND